MPDLFLGLLAWVLASLLVGLLWLSLPGRIVLACLFVVVLAPIVLLMLAVGLFLKDPHHDR